MNFASFRPLLPAACLLILVAAIPGLRGPALSDEVFSLDAAALPWSGLLPALGADVHPPLYYILLKVWLLPAGATLAALRAFSLTCALFSLLQMARLARRLVPAHHQAAGALLASGALFVLLSTYGRMYSLLLLSCILTWSAAAWVLSANRSCGPPAALALCVTAGLLTHNYFVFFLAALTVWALAVHRRRAFKLAAPAAAGALLYALLWGPEAFGQLTSRPQHLAWLSPPTFGSLLDGLAAHLWLLALASPLALVTLALRKSPPPWQWSRAHTAAALAAALALALPWAVSYITPIYNPRFTIVAAPFLAVALIPIAARAGPAYPLAALTVAVAWMWWPASSEACTSALAARILSVETRPSDTVVFCRLTRKPVEYYWPRAAPKRQSFPAQIDLHPGYEGRVSPAEIDRQAAALAGSIEGRVYVLADTASGPSQTLMRALTRAGFILRPPLLSAGSASKHYFNRLLVYDPPVTAAQSPSAPPPG